MKRTMIQPEPSVFFLKNSFETILWQSVKHLSCWTYAIEYYDRRCQTLWINPIRWEKINHFRPGSKDCISDWHISVSVEWCFLLQIRWDFSFPFVVLNISWIVLKWFHVHSKRLPVMTQAEYFSLFHDHHLSAMESTLIFPGIRKCACY